MASGDARIVITVDAAGAVTAVRDFDQALQGTKLTADSASSGLGSLWQQFALGQVVVTAAYRALGFLKESLLDGIQDAADYEKAFRGLSAAFDISGRTMPGMVEDLKKYATQMRDLGLADESSVARTESLILTLTNLDEKGVKAATRGAIGLASVMGVDLRSAAEMVARGMEGNYFALGRLIPAVRMAADEESKRAAMMKAFEDLYARAIVDTDTYAGQVKKLDIAWTDAKRSFIESTHSLEILRGAAQEVADILDRLSGESSRKRTQATDDFIEAEKEASQILWQVGDATGHASSWAYDLGETYHWTAQQVLENVRAGTEGIKEQKAAEEAVKAHNLAIDAQGKGYSETGQTLAQLVAKWNKGRATLDDMTTAIIQNDEAVTKENPFLFILKENEEECAKAIEESNREFEKQARVTGEARAAAEGYARSVVKNITDPLHNLTQGGVIQALQKAQAELKGLGDSVPVERFRTLDQEITDAMTAIEVMNSARTRSLTNDQTVFSMLGDSLNLLSEDIHHHSVILALAMKAVAMAEAYINTALAATKVIGQLGIFGIPMVPMIWGIGMAQMALIAATPIPTATGFEGIVRQPTLFLAGEAGPERVSVRNQTQMNNSTSTINVAIYSSGVVDGNKVWKEIEYQARRRGVKIGRA